MRFIKRFLVLSFLVLVAAGLSAFLLLRGSLPRLDGELSVHGIEAPVIIERDAAGIPVITARNRTDLAFATGFVHGQDRFFQMDLSRRRAAGELAALFGPIAVALDQRNRLHRFRNRARALIASMPVAETTLLSAYAAGVNEGWRSLDVWPFEYLLLRSKPQSWRPEDSLLVAYNMFLELNDERAVRDTSRGLAREALPPAMFDFLYPQGTSWDAPLLGQPRAIMPIPTATDLSAVYLESVRRSNAPVNFERQVIVGSNNWAIAGSLSDSGRAIVANDMHLDITVPNVFYRARLKVAGAAPLDLTGVTLPGVPLLIAGSNGDIAWGNTNSYGDWSDAVIVRRGDAPDSYLTPDGQRRFTTYLETIQVKGADDEELRVRETIWGPLIESTADANQLIAASWLAHKPLAVNLRGLDLETAKSAEEALDVANQMGLPPQNFVVGDAAGNIGWTIAGRIPLRGAYDATLPADWSESSGWLGWLPAVEYPRVLNPESGRIWTANARVVDDEALGKIGDGGYDLGARASQIRDRLSASDRFAATDMLAIQLDDRAVFLSRWQRLLLRVLEDGAGGTELRQYAKLVEGWESRASADSVGYRLVRDFRRAVRDRVFSMLMQPVRDRFAAEARLSMSNQFEGPLWALVVEQPAHLLSAEYASWDALLLAAIDDNLGDYRDNYEGGLSRRTWGELNQALIRHPLGDAVPGIARWLNMPRDSLPGDSNMPRVQSPTFGASERFAVAPGDEAHGYMHMPVGQSGHPLSVYYRHGHEDWVEGRSSAFLPGDARHTLALKPENWGKSGGRIP